MKGKMTAVDWLGDVIEISPDNKKEVSLLGLAKEVEKAQIIKAYEQGRVSVLDITKPVTGKQYYKENYK